MEMAISNERASGNSRQVVNFQRMELRTCESEHLRARIKKLEDEISHCRFMQDQIVLEKTELLNIRLSILESCNISLGENYHQMHQMYLELLTKVHDYESAAGVNLL